MVEPSAPRRLSTRARVLLGIAGAVVTVVVLAVVTFGPARDREVSNLGDDVFDFRAADLATRIAADGRPRLFADLVGGDRPLWVNHVGDDPESGWYAFAAVAPPPPEDCVVDWLEAEEVFEDCEGRRYPETGEGLRQFPVTVDGSVASIDLNFDAREPEATG